MTKHPPKTFKANIMVVDDTSVNLHLLSKMLQERGYSVRPLTDGARAIAAAKAEPPDLILLDIMMPEMSGYEVCEKLKASKGDQEHLREIPIIFISALNEVLDKVKAFKLGGVDYITKPFQEEEVFARLETHLTLRNLQKQLETQNKQLQEALDNVKTLKGLLPICANCKKIRDDGGYWNQIEGYLQQHTDALFSHGLCPHCETELYGDEKWYQEMQHRLKTQATSEESEEDGE
ncbi:response regulator [Desulfococcaceae bacterium HSG7]|nr:response regulator [Desulfococcaceae bacterium HSG9]MDM8553862.1 response regulator [Desulfococcaceae bacterium HSG7]